MLSRSERRAVILIVLTFALVYAYFFQGGGWNQNSRFDTIRALVERGTLEISDYSQNTGDTSMVGDRIYSNKPPGLAFVGAPVYLLAYIFEMWLGVNPGDPNMATANAHLLTFITSGLPGTLLLVVIFLCFRRRQIPVHDSLFLVGAFGVGSLILPYAGVMMNHNLVALCLFAAWFLVTSSTINGRKLLAGGSLLGIAVLSNYVALPLIMVYALYLLLSLSSTVLHETYS